MLIKAKNNLDTNAQFTFLGDSVVSGAGTLGVKNIASFSDNWAIQIGKTGEEKSEIKILSSSSGTNLVLSGTTLFDHPVDTPIYAIKFDQLIFKRSTSGTAGTAVALTSGTVSITPDSVYTQFDDTSGASTYAYKASFRNSVTLEVSNDSGWLTPAGFSFYSLSKIRERAKDKLFNAGYLKTDDSQIDAWINEWLETMNNSAVDVNEDYNLGTVDVSHGTAGLGTISSTDFKEVRRVWYTTGGNQFYQATRMHINDFDPNETFDATNPYFYYFGDDVIGKKPDGVVGTARVTYYRLGTVLTQDADELPVSMRGYTKSFVNYGLANAYYLDQKTDLGDRFMAMANADLDKFKKEISPRSKTGPQMIGLSEPVSGDTYYS